MPGHALPAGFVTELELTRYSAPYRRRLAEGLAHFRSWLAARGSNVDTAPRPGRRATDDALARYVQDCYSSGGAFSLSKHAVLAVQHLLQLRGKLPRAWAALWSWKLERPQGHRLPVPLEFLQGAFLDGLDQKKYIKFCS